MERVRIFVLCSFFFVITVSMNEAVNVTKIEFITADVIEEKWKMNETFHHVCKLPDEERVKFCKDLLKMDFALRNDIKYNEGERLGEEMRYEFALNDGLGITLIKQRIHMTACTCPTTPPLYLRNDFGKETSVQVYARLPFSAHGPTTERKYPERTN